MPDDQPTEAPKTEPEEEQISSVEVQETEVTETAKSRGKFRKLLKFWPLAVGIAALGLGLGGLAYANHLRNQRTAETAQTSQTSVTSGEVSLLEDKTFVRYERNAAYEKDEKGKVKQNKEDDGSYYDVRKDSFDLNLERNGKTSRITLDSSIESFGVTNDGQFFALSCESPGYGKRGAENPLFKVQFYDKDGNKSTTKSWHQEATDAPKGLKYISCKSTYETQPAFSIDDYSAEGRIDFSDRGFGREAIDNLNYKVVYKSADGTTVDIDRETASDIDIPLGGSPDGNYFMYARLSSKRVAAGCGEEVKLEYKIPDFFGSINELHVYNLKTNTDTLLGTEKSFGDNNHHINISTPGYFSADSGRYYLKEGKHAGCGDSVSVPIRIAYIDLKTNKLEGIKAPPGRNYDQYCFTDDGKFALEWGVVDDYNDKTTEVVPSPTVLDTKDSVTYQLDDLTNDFQCDRRHDMPGVFFDLTTKTAGPDDTYTDTSLLGFKILDPAKRSLRRVTLDKPLEIADSVYLKSTFLTSDSRVAYINRSGNYTEANYVVPDTLLINLLTGETATVKAADLVL